MHYISFNGSIYPDTEPILQASNGSFKWGDGLFETIKVMDGKIQLASFHFERLFTGLRLLGMENKLSESDLIQQVIELCTRNNFTKARVRLAVYRQEDGSAGTLIEAKPLPESSGQWNEQGLKLGLYPFARRP